MQLEKSDKIEKDKTHVQVMVSIIVNVPLDVVLPSNCHRKGNFGTIADPKPGRSVIERWN